VVRLEGGKASEVANTWDLESGQNPDTFGPDSHPYGLAAGPGGMLWVADAGGNDLLKIDPSSGKVSVAAVFAGLLWPKEVPVPPMMAQGNPERGGKMELDPVPTTVVPQEDGSAFVSLLSGFPFLSGTSKVVKVAADGKVSDFATDPKFSMLTDLRQGPDGNLYAVSFARFEFGAQGPAPVPGSGAVYRITQDGKATAVLEGLLFPTSLDFGKGGDLYVTVGGAGAPGSGSLVMYKGLAK